MNRLTFAFQPRRLMIAPAAVGCMRMLARPQVVCRDVRNSQARARISTRAPKLNRNVPNIESRMRVGVVG